MQRKKRYYFKLAIIVLVEIFLYFIIFINIREVDYSGWKDNKAVIFFGYAVSQKGIKTLQPSTTVIFVNYTDEYNTEHPAEIEFENFPDGFEEGQEIEIKYNPQNYDEAVYPVYEKFRVKYKREMILYLFLFIIFVTVSGAILNVRHNPYIFTTRQREIEKRLRQKYKKKDLF